MIKPTLFVGLGTTGTRTLKYLRRLMYEEYEQAGLPIFRYISIETDGSESGEDQGLRTSGQMRDYEQIKVIRATISATHTIEDKISLNSPNHDPELTRWLNPELLKIGEKSFESGAKNIRMAGRLCMWENWQEIEQTIKNERDAMIAPGNTKEAHKILKEHTLRKGLKGQEAGLDLDAIDVYICGSLCGGTCSGMFIDIAYFFRSIFSTGASGSVPKIYGIFTMFDADLAMQPGNEFRAANCYGALWELNYYFHKDTTFNLTWPSGQIADRIKDPPMDYVLFVSRSGKTNTVRFNTPDGKFDEEGLNQMVALNLFADVVGDSSGRKDAIRCDWHSHPKYRQPKEVARGEISTMVRYMASFGLTAVWYPKYRISSAAACLIGKRLCESWLCAQKEQTVIKDQAREECRKLIRENIDVLTSPKGGKSLKDQVSQQLSQARSQMKRPSTANALQQMVQKFPHGEPFQQQFAKNSDFYNHMELQAPLCLENLRQSLWELLRNQVSKINFEGNYGLADVSFFFQIFDEEAALHVNQCPARMPAFDLTDLDFAPLQRAEQNWRLKWVNLQKQSLEQHKNSLVDHFCQIVEKAFADLRNWFLRSILIELRQQLGFELKPDKVHMEDRKTIYGAIKELEAKLEHCCESFDDSYRDAIEPPKQINVLIVTGNQENSIEMDAGRLDRQIQTGDIGGQLLGKKTMFEFLCLEQSEIRELVKEHYRRFALSKLADFHVTEKAREMLASGATNPVTELARRSNPYLTFKNGYTPQILGTPPTLICGHDPSGNALQELKSKLGEKNHSFERINSSPVEHLLFFYKEEGGFAIDDLNVHTGMSRLFEKNPGEYGHFTHQDPTFFDLSFAFVRNTLQTWTEALAILVPRLVAIDDQAFERVLFSDPKNNVQFCYRMEGAMEDEMYLENDPGGINRLANPQNRIAYEWFAYLVKSDLRRLKIGLVRNVITNYLAGLERDEKNRRRKFFETFTREIFDEGILQEPRSYNPTVLPNRELPGRENRTRAGEPGSQKEAAEPEPTIAPPQFYRSNAVNAELPSFVEKKSDSYQETRAVRPAEGYESTPVFNQQQVSYQMDIQDPSYIEPGSEGSSVTSDFEFKTRKIPEEPHDQSTNSMDHCLTMEEPIQPGPNGKSQGLNPEDEYETVTIKPRNDFDPGARETAPFSDSADNEEGDYEKAHNEEPPTFSERREPDPEDSLSMPAIERAIPIMKEPLKIKRVNLQKGD